MCSSDLNCGDPRSPRAGMWGTTGCDIVILGRVIVGEIVGKLGSVSDGNGVDGNDGLVSNGVISEVARVGFGSACSLRVVSVVLYKRDGIGCDMSDSSKIERVFQIPSLRSRRRLECRGSVLWDVGYTVLCAMPHVRLWLQRLYGWNGMGWSCKRRGPILKSSLAVGSKMMYLGCDKDQ